MRTSMEKLIVQIFETKRRIIEQVKQHMDLYDQHLASECLLEGVAPPEWLWSPYFPFQTSEDLNKEDIISGLLFPHSRPSIVCPGSRRVSYQQPVALAHNAKTLEVTSGFNQPSDKQLLEEEWQHLSRNNLKEVGCSPHCAHEQDHNFASPSNFQEERALETTATCHDEQNASSTFPEYSRDERVKSAATASCAQDIDFTCPGYCQGEGIPNSVSTSGCEQDHRITSPESCQEKIAPDSCPDPTLSLARIQRSKSRQRALELRSSVKASKSHSNCKRDLQDSLSENVGSEIRSLRSNINQTKLFEHDENDEGRCKAEEVDNCKPQDIEKYQDIMPSTTAKSRSPCQKAGSIRKSSALDKYASVAPESGCSNSQPETSCMNEITLLQPIDTADEGFAKEEEEKACDPLSKRCDEIVYLNEVTRSKDSTAEISSKNSTAGGSPSSPLHELSLLGKPKPHDFDEKEEQNFDEMAMNRQEEPSKESLLLISAAKGTCDKSLAQEEMCTLEEYDGLKKECVPVEGLPMVHSVLKARESEPSEANIGLPVKDISVFCHDALANNLKKRDSLFVPNALSDVSAKLQAPGHLNFPERRIQAFCSSSPVIECSRQPNKRRRTMDKLSYRMPASAFPGGDVLDSGSVDKKLGTVERSKECQNFNHYDVELQKMIGSGSSPQFQLEEGSLFMEAGVRSPDAIIFREEEFSRGGSQITLHHGVGSGNTEFMPSTRETSHLLASEGVHDSVGSPHVQPIGLKGSDDESLPVMEGFVIQTDDEKQSCSGTQISLDSLKLPKTTVECPNILEQIRSSTMNTPLLHIPTTLNFNGKLDLFQSVPNGLLEGMLLSNSLSEKYDESKEPEASSLFANLGIEHAFHGRSHSDCLPFSGGGSSVDARNPCVSPIGKLWYRSMPKSASSMTRQSSSPDLPCIDEENENMDEEAEKLLYRNTPGSASSDKSGSPGPDLPPINEENADIDEAAGTICEGNHSKMKSYSAEKIPLAVVNENMEFPAPVSEAKMPVDRQSLESVNTGFSFTATCNSVKSKVGKQNGGKRRRTGKGKENRGVFRGENGARKNTDLLKNRSSKPKLSENSSLTTQGPCLSEKEPGHNNIVSNITSFIPLVQPKPAAAVITGKRDVKVKALEAAEAAKRLAEKKENERKIKKEALKVERARQEQENLRKQELEKKKKEDEWKKKEAEMAERKRQRAEEEKKLKEAKKKRLAEAHRQQRKTEVKSHTEKGEKELNTRAMDLRTNQVKEHKVKDEPGNAEEFMQEQANYRIPEAGSKASIASKSSADDLKVGKVSEETIFPTETIEESYDISPYKCSDDEDEDEDEDVPNNKFVPSWASKNCILLTISSQQNVDPEKIFPPKSFCSISEVLMPRIRRSR